MKISPVATQPNFGAKIKDTEDARTFIDVITKQGPKQTQEMKEFLKNLQQIAPNDTLEIVGTLDYSDGHDSGQLWQINNITKEKYADEKMLKESDFGSNYKQNAITGLFNKLKQAVNPKTVENEILFGTSFREQYDAEKAKETEVKVKKEQEAKEAEVKAKQEQEEIFNLLA